MAEIKDKPYVNNVAIAGAPKLLLRGKYEGEPSDLPDDHGYS